MEAVANAPIGGVKYIFPVEMFSQKADEKRAKKAIKKLEKEKQKDEKLYENIREKIVEETCEYTIKEIEKLHVASEKISDASVAADVTDKYNNAKEAHAAHRRTVSNIVLTGLGVAAAIAGIAATGPAAAAVIPAAWATVLTNAGSGVAIATGLSAIKDAVASGRGLKSDAQLKDRDYKKEFEALYANYQYVLDYVDKNKNMLINKKKEMSKEEFDEYLRKEIVNKLKNDIAEMREDTKGASGESREINNVTEPEGERRL